MSSAEEGPKGKAWAIPALRSLNGHLLIFFICPVKTRHTNQLIVIMVGELNFVKYK